MTLEILLSISNVAFSIGALVPVFYLKDQKKALTLAVIIAALVASSSVALYNAYQHERLISRIQGEILKELEHEILTFDQLYLELHYRPFPIVSEALFRAVELGSVEHKMIEMQKEARIVQVRGYFVSGG